MDDAYRPIACALQDRFERAAITGTALTVAWRDGARYIQDQVRVLDLETSRGAEYLHFRDSRGAHHRIRLDYVTILDEMSGG
ncbi:MAG: transcriptional antiterminator, Rof [Acidiferrobacter sp.]